MSQGVAVALVTSASHGTEAVRRRHSKCRGDGSLWESHTLCHYSDTCGHKEETSLQVCLFPIRAGPQVVRWKDLPVS